MGVAWRNSQMVMRKMDHSTWAKDRVRVHSNGEVVHFRKATGKITWCTVTVLLYGPGQDASKKDKCYLICVMGRVFSHGMTGRSRMVFSKMITGLVKVCYVIWTGVSIAAGGTRILNMDLVLKRSWMTLSTRSPTKWSSGTAKKSLKKSKKVKWRIWAEFKNENEKIDFQISGKI